MFIIIWLKLWNTMYQEFCCEIQWVQWRHEKSFATFFDNFELKKGIKQDVSASQNCTKLDRPINEAESVVELPIFIFYKKFNRDWFHWEPSIKLTTQFFCSVKQFQVHERCQIQYLNWIPGRYWVKFEVVTIVLCLSSRFKSNWCSIECMRWTQKKYDAM